VAIVVLATPLTLKWGAMGTIAGVGLTMALAFSLSCVYVFRQVSLSFVATFLPASIAGLVAAGVLLASRQLAVWGQLAPLVRALATGIFGTGTFLLVLLALRPAEMIERLRYAAQLWVKHPAN
jgi:hypothetical protein